MDRAPGIGWMKKIGVALAAAIALGGGLTFAPAEAEAQAGLPTWPAFPAEQSEAGPPTGFTPEQLNAVICQKDNDRKCDHQGLESGSGVTITSLCQYRDAPPRVGLTMLEYCQVTFSDNRYELFFETGQQNNEVHAEVKVNGREIPGQQENVGTITVNTNPETGDREVVSQESNASGACNLFNGGNFGDCLISILGKVGANIIWILVQVFGVLLGLVGVIFNWVVLVTVFQFSTYFGNSEGLLTAWSVLRDIGNIMLLFGFIFIGLQTILNVGHFSVGKALPRLLIFAILINFSLLVSSAIIDTANIFSASLYSSMGGVNCAVNPGQPVPEECTGYGIAGRIQAASGLGNIADSSGGIGEIWSANDGVGMFTVYLGLLLLIIIMMVVLIAAIIMLLFRALTLMILMVLSPIAFAATAIPQFEEFSSAWWKKLISQAFFAPVFLLMLFVGLKIMDGANDVFGQGGASLTTAFASGDANVGGIFILFFLIVGFVVAALISASQLGAMGASFATRQAGNAVFGNIAKIGRHTAGRYLYKKAEALEKSGSKFSRSNEGKLLKSALMVGGKASFDMRDIGAVGAVAKGGHIDLGKTKSGGYAQVLHDEEKSHTDYADKLKNSEAEKKQIQALEELVKIAGKEYNLQAAELREKHAKDTDLVRKREEIEAVQKRAQAARDLGGIDRDAELQLSVLYNERDQILAKQKQELDSAKQAYEAQVNLYKNGDDEKKIVGIKQIKELPKRTYAHNIKTPNILTRGNVYGHAGEHAGHKIIAELDKTEKDKLYDAFKKATEPKDEGHGEAKGGSTDDHSHVKHK